MVSPFQARINVQYRTNAKLKYAGIHLEEITSRQEKGSADDFERAHEESFLFHLIGTKDSFLQEINAAYKLELPLYKVKEDELRRALKANSVESPALNEIVRLEEKLEVDKAGWLAVAIEIRNRGTHRSNIPRILHGSTRKENVYENKAKVFLTNPLTGQPIETDIPVLLQEYLTNMEDLIQEQRPTLPQESEGDV